MSTIPAVSALDARTQTFPVLTSAQTQRARAAGSIRPVKAGEVLFRPGDVGIPMFILLSGGMEILQPSYLGERLITTHAAGHFTGELSMIAGQRCLVLGRVNEAGEFLEIPATKLRELIGRDAELSELFMRAFILRRLTLITQKLGNVILLGSRHSAETLHLREFLDRNGHPHTYVDLDRDKESQQLLDHFAVKVEDIPLVICNGLNVLRNPSTRELADCLGLNATFDNSEVRDVVIVGAGPAGLGAAVYAASEGLNSLLIETEAPGGQAGSSSKIENYLGFPTGISGQELAARALNQAQKFGARMVIARSAIKLDCGKHPYKLVLDDGAVIATRAIIIATGARYNKPEIENLEKFEGRGVYYGATHIEAQLCSGEDAVVVGGGNSAGQAAIFVSQIARKVYMLVRAGGLAETMSRYLIQRIAENPNIELLCSTEIKRLEGETELKRVAWVNNITGESSTHSVRHVFVMTGASPRTDWLRGCVALDDKGFILTGRDLEPGGRGTLSASWPLARAPQMLETSLPGVFAVGDVRSGNVKRVASAVGEGAISVHLVHRTLAEL